MSQTNKLSKSYKFLSVVLGALLMGFMWRARGTHGFGSFWGLVCVGSMATLLIFAFYGNRSKMKAELIPMGAIIMGITVPAWGAVVNMAGGEMLSETPFGNNTEQTVTAISQGEGIVLMLMLGFGLVCLYGIFVGTLFSGKEYKIIHYLIYIAVFFAVVYIAKATFAHILLRYIAPEVANAFKSGLEDKGIYLSWREAYLAHFDNMSWAKKIPFGRCYYESIEHIAYTCGALALIITALAVFRDKTTALVSLAVNIVAAFAITISEFFNINDMETSFTSKLSLPSFLSVSAWSLWEFFTGFFLGLGIMLIIALIPDKYTSGAKYRSKPYIENKYLRFILNVGLYEFVFVVVPVRAIMLRLARNAEEYGFIASEDIPEIIAIAVLSVILAIPVISLCKKNILDKNLPVPYKMKPCSFANVSLLILSVYYSLVYFLSGEGYLVRFIYRIIKSPSGLKENLTGDFISLPVVLAASLLFIIIYLPVRKSLPSHQKH